MLHFFLIVAQRFVILRICFVLAPFEEEYRTEFEFNHVYSNSDATIIY